MAPAAAYPHDPIELHWRGSALELMGALVLDDEKSGDLPLHGRCDQHGSRLGGGLNAGGDVGRFPEHFAPGVDDHLAAFDANAYGKPGSAGRRVSAVHLLHRLLDAKGGPNGSFGVILLRLRIAEASHEPVAKPLEHAPVERCHRPRGLIEIAVDEIAPVLDVESSREFGRADKVAEHDGDRAPFGGIELRRAKRHGRPVRGKLRYRFEEPPAVAERDAEFLEVAVGEISEHVQIDLVLAKPFLVLTKTEASEPPADIHDHRSRRGARNYPCSSREWRDKERHPRMKGIAPQWVESPRGGEFDFTRAPDTAGVRAGRRGLTRRRRSAARALHRARCGRRRSVRARLR